MTPDIFVDFRLETEKSVLIQKMKPYILRKTIIAVMSSETLFQLLRCAPPQS